MCSPELRRLARAAAVLACLLDGSASPAAADPITDYHLAWNWPVTGRRIAQGGLEAADLDGDGGPEVLTTGDGNAFTTRGGYWYVLDGRQGLTRIAGSLPFESGLRAVASGLGAAGRRVVALGPASISVWDAATRSLLAEFPIATSDARALAVADLHGDGALEAVVCDLADLRVYDVATGAALGVAAGFGCSLLATGQTDGDAQLEIALAGNAGGGFVLDGASLAIDWSDPRGFGNRLALGDFDGDGLDEIASTISDFSGIRVQDPASGATLWEIPAGYLSALAAADLDPSPAAEVVWGDGSGQGWIRVLAGGTGTELWRIPYAGSPISAIAAGDVDGDGVPEILWGVTGYGSSAEVIRTADGATHLIEAETHDLRPPLEGLAVADVDADGRLEVATASHASNGSSGGVFLEHSFDQGRLLRESPRQFPGSFGETISATAVVQLDADPALELCAVGGSSFEGALGCYDGSSFAEQWRLLIGDLPTTLLAAELDGDPRPELLVGTDRQAFVYAFEGESGWLKWRTPDSSVTPRAFNRLRFADTGGDGLPEVIAGFAFATTFVGQLTTFDPGTGAFLAGPWDVPTYSMALRPAVPGPGEELLLGRANGQVVPVDPATGIVGAAIATFPGAVSALAVADVTRDGVLDLVAASGGRVRIFDGQAGAVVWTSPFLGDGAGLDEGLLAGNLDGDTFPEILVTTGVGVALFEPTLPALFADSFESGDTSAWSTAVP